jgi:hypothetical protein
MNGVRHAHPIVFMFLILPFGVMSGYLTVAVAYLLTQAGVSVEQVAELVAISFIPQTWKFLWAPIADTTLTRKSWYLIGSVISALGIYATGAVPADGKFMPLLYVVVVVSNTAVTFLAMSVESLMVYGTPAAEKGRAGGWFQAGNLGGGGLGGGAGLWMAQTLSQPWIAGAVLGGACLLFCVALLFVTEPPAVFRDAKYWRNIVDVFMTCGGWRARGRLSCIVDLLPCRSAVARPRDYGPRWPMIGTHPRIRSHWSPECSAELSPPWVVSSAAIFAIA